MNQLEKKVTEFAPLVPKIYSYLTNDSDEHKKAKAQKGVP